MKKLFLMMMAAATLGGCIDREMFVKSNITYDRYERDFVGCATTATQNVPTNTQVGWMPYVGVYSADVNTELRKANFELCMRDKGYSEVTLPMCEGSNRTKASEQAALPQDRSRRMRINSNSCYVLKSDQSLYLYTP